MHATTDIAAPIPHALRRSPGPPTPATGYLRMLIEAWREVRSLQQTHAHWPHIDG
jgi:hypothetical protein